MSTKTFKELAKTIESLRGHYKQKVIGIDGGSGAGKSTFASLLQNELASSEVIHIDDFYKGLPHKAFDHQAHEVSPNFDWDRLEQEVFIPLRNGSAIEYGIYNWHTNAIDSKKEVSQDATILIEGLEVTQKRFADDYDLKIWIECDITLRLTRGVERDGETMREMWEKDWLPFDEVYSKVQNPKSRADIIVDGQFSNYSNGEYSVL